MLRRFVALLAPLLAVSLRLFGQTADPARFVAGALLESVVSPADSSQRYAVFLPSRYDPHTPQPLLCVMDPRGRALIPLRLLQAGAERFGFVLLSSYNTLSDGPGDPNEAAVNAMIGDAQRIMSIDTRRIYLVGFSGTARAAWDFAYRLDGHVAGVLGFGAGFPPGWVPPPPTVGAPQTLVFYGGAGNTDFNYQEVQGMDAVLQRSGVRHHIARYEGPHGWPPEAVMDDALQWMQLQAMRRGLVATDSAWIDSLYRVDSAAVQAATSSGDGYEGYLRARAVQMDFAGLHDVSGDSMRVAAMARSAGVRRALQRRIELADRYHQYIAVLQRFVGRVRDSKKPPKLAPALKELQITRLQRQAADSSDRLASLGATQLLEQVFVVTVFYEPREALNAGNPARALALLDIAEAIHPGVGFVCSGRKEALTRAGRAEAAAELHCPSN